MKPWTHDRYLKFVARLKARYTTAGALVVSVGGVPTRYAVLESAAWSRLRAS
jgi:hypothetical protein